MSHFAVAIFHKAGQKIEELLAPYQENNMGDCPKQYMEFNSVTEEYVKKYEEASEETQKKYPSCKEFIENYAGHKFNEEKQDYGYWENPNAKWDWWGIGGRYSGLLKVKEGASEWVDSALIKDIDFDGMRTLNTAKYEEYWDEALYENEVKKYFMYGIQKDDTKETYVNRNTEFCTYGVITPDGKWHSKGEMGWFGMSSETQEESERWNKSFKETFIDNADESLRLTIVDCHI
jgi:hypothetical protein